MMCRTIVRRGFRPSERRDGFTLLELMVVIAIIVLLVGSILVPSLMIAQEYARDAKCKACLHGLHDALLAHRQASRRPDAWTWLQIAEEIDASELTVCPLGGFAHGGGHVQATLTGAVVSITPPPSVVFNDFESNTEIRMFVERTNYTLPCDIRVNISLPGRYGKSNSSYNSTATILAEGTAVDCHFVFFDPVGSQSSVVSGSITMGAEILGIICVRAELDTTDPPTMLGRPGTQYATGQNSRDFENSREDISLSEDRRTITIHEWHSTFPGENMRVLTRPSSAGAGSFAMNIGVDPDHPRPDQIFLMDYNTSVIFPDDPWHIMALEDMKAEGRLHLGSHLNAAMTDGSVRDFTPAELGPDNPHW